jgi:hypothetical protein
MPGGHGPGGLGYQLPPLEPAVGGPALGPTAGYAIAPNSGRFSSYGSESSAGPLGAHSSSGAVTHDPPCGGRRRRPGGQPDGCSAMGGAVPSRRPAMTGRGVSTVMLEWIHNRALSLRRSDAGDLAARAAWQCSYTLPRSLAGVRALVVTHVHRPADLPLLFLSPCATAAAGTAIVALGGARSDDAGEAAGSP